MKNIRTILIRLPALAITTLVRAYKAILQARINASMPHFAESALPSATGICSSTMRFSVRKARKINGFRPSASALGTCELMSRQFQLDSSLSFGDAFAMNRERLMWYLLGVLVLSASLSACLPQAVAQKAQDRNQVNPGQTVIPWESPARLHQLMGTKKGTLMIGEEGIEFRSEKGRTMNWPFLEIQTFLLSPQRLAIETYENRKHHVPGMQRYKFDFDQAVSPERAAQFSMKIQRPSQNAVPDPASKGIVIPAHHRTLTGGTNGNLRLSDSGIDYVTGVRGDSRSWRWADLQTLSDPDPFHLLVFGYRDTYTFDLKSPLSQSLFYRLVNALDAQNVAGPAMRTDFQSPHSAEKHE